MRPPKLRTPRLLPSLALHSALALGLCLTACTPLPGKPPVGPSGAPTATGKPPVNPGKPIGSNGATLIGQDGATLIGLDGATLIGLDGATLIGQDGATLIGQDGATLITDGGSTLIGQDGATLSGSVKAPAGMVAAGAGNLVAAGAGNLTGAAGGKAVSDLGALYRLSALAEQPLAGVHVYLRTPGGQFFVGKDGKLITAVTDAQGRYAFKGLKAGRGLVVCVPSARVDGDVRALLGFQPKDAAATAEVAVDLGSTLTTGWLLGKVLAAQAGDQRAASADRVPAALLAEARTALVSAVGDTLPAGAGSLATAGLSQAVEALRRTNGTLNEALRRVEAVAGVSNLTAGLDQAQVAFQRPIDVAQAPDGTVYVLEEFGGRIRRIDPQGKVSVILGQGSPNEGTLGALFLKSMKLGPDGNLYAGSATTRQVYRVAPDGSRVETVVGGGSQPAQDGMKATDARIEDVESLCWLSDGSLLVGENSHESGVDIPRLLRLKPDGALAVEPSPWTALGIGLANREVSAIAVGADGTTWVTDYAVGEVYVREPGGPWRRIAENVTFSSEGGITALPDGTLVAGTTAPERNRLGARLELANRLIRFDRTGAATVFAGSGETGLDDGPAAAATFSSPCGTFLRPDGSLLVADRENGVIRAVSASGVVSLAYGARRAPDEIAAEASLNVPGGIAVDGQGRVLVTEYGGNVIRRLEGDVLRRVAGGLRGRVGDGASTTADRLSGPAGLAADGEALCLIEVGTSAVRRLNADGTLETLAGGGGKPRQTTAPTADAPVLARERAFDSLLNLAVDPRDHSVYFSERDVTVPTNDHVWRIAADGRLTLFAGGFAGAAAPDTEGVLATDVQIGRVAGMAFSPAGELHLTEALSGRIVKIDAQGKLRVVAGAGTAATLMRMGTGASLAEGDVPALDALLLLPAGLAFDAKGNLYVAELGTRAVQGALGESGFGGFSGIEIPLLDGRVRKIDTAGVAHVLAGLGAPGGPAGVHNPMGVAVTPAGKVYFVDQGTGQVKAI